VSRRETSSLLQSQSVVKHNKYIRSGFGIFLKVTGVRPDIHAQCYYLHTYSITVVGGSNYRSTVIARHVQWSCVLTYGISGACVTTKVSKNTEVHLACLIDI